MYRERGREREKGRMGEREKEGESDPLRTLCSEWTAACVDVCMRARERARRKKKRERVIADLLRPASRIVRPVLTGVCV